MVMMIRVVKFLLARFQRGARSPVFPSRYLTQREVDTAHLMTFSFHAITSLTVYLVACGGSTLKLTSQHYLGQPHPLFTPRALCTGTPILKHFRYGDLLSPSIDAFFRSLRFMVRHKV